MNRALVICGPTASGKTHYAHLVAGTRNGEIINCDSMQVYKQTPIITASPDDALKNELSYHLYNCIDISEKFSVAKYIELGANSIRETLERGKLPIIVGGSGMYVNALLNGINYMPDISDDIKKEVRNAKKNNGSEFIYDLLKKIDLRAASKLNPGDSQRVMRAYEVALQTGKSILEFQASTPTRLLPDVEFEIVMLNPERSFLYDTCNKRLQNMFKNGAIEEVEGIIKNPDKRKLLLDIKPLGAVQIIDYLDNKISKEEALDIASIKTRQYAKRQITWFKNQTLNKTVIEFSNIDQYERKKMTLNNLLSKLFS